jgi:hypothetical protein
MARPQLDGCPQGRLRAGDVARPPACRSEVVLRVEERGVELDRALELGNRFRRATL